MILNLTLNQAIWDDFSASEHVSLNPVQAFLKATDANHFQAKLLVPGSFSKTLLGKQEPVPEVLGTACIAAMYWIADCFASSSSFCGGIVFCRKFCMSHSDIPRTGLSIYWIIYLQLQTYTPQETANLFRDKNIRWSAWDQGHQHGLPAGAAFGLLGEEERSQRPVPRFLNTDLCGSSPLFLIDSS